MAGDNILSSLKGMLGDNADEKISAVMNALQGSGAAHQNTENNVEESISISEKSDGLPISVSQNQGSRSPDSVEYISKIKSIIDDMGSANDPRSNLLMSLRPYMRDNRKKSIDNAVKLLNLSRASGLFRI